MDILEIKRDEIMDAFTGGFDEMEYYLDRRTGEIILIMEDEFENKNDSTEPDKNPARYLYIDPIESNEAFKIMEDFIAVLNDEKAKKELTAALENRKPFRCFKDKLYNFPAVQDKYFQYHEERIAGRAISWLKEIGIEGKLI